MTTSKGPSRPPLLLSADEVPPPSLLRPGPSSPAHDPSGTSRSPRRTGGRRPSEEGSSGKRRKAGALAVLPVAIVAVLVLSPLGGVFLGSIEATLLQHTNVLSSAFGGAPGGSSSPPAAPAPRPVAGGGNGPSSGSGAPPPAPYASAACPNGNYYGQPTTLTLQQVVSCALDAGFSGPEVITFASMAFQESGFDPAAIEPGPHAEGVLQEGTAGQSPPQGNPFPLSGYSPSTCTTYAGGSDWGPIYFDPSCAFEWALAYYHVNGYNFWGSYLTGAYCQWAPSGFVGTGPIGCSGAGQNQAGLPWSLVCPNDVCSGSTVSGGGGPSYDGSAAAAYATSYMGVVGSDGYYWVNGGSQLSFPLGTTTPTIASQYGIGDDCTHFASLALEAGGLSVPTVAPPSYGNPSVNGLRNYLLQNGLASEVQGTSLPSSLQPGDLILYEWAGTGTWDHTAVYLGNGLVAEHSYGNGAGSVVTTPQAWNNPGGGAALFDFLHILGNGGGGGKAPPCPNLAPGGTALLPSPQARPEGPTTSAVPSSPSSSGTGYWIVGADGGIFSFGNAGFFGSAAQQTLGGCIVGMATTPDGQGYWLVGADGGVLAWGDAGFFGSMGGKTLNAPVVGIAATPDGKGYWLVASDGGVFSFGDAVFYGSMGGKALNAPMVGIAATPDGRGYWTVAADGGIFSFGDAGFFGSMGGKTLNAPMVGMARTADGKGYWLTASDGGVFAFGDAGFYGSMGGKSLNAPVVGIAPTPDEKGYWLVGADGGIFSFGDAAFLGSMGGTKLNAPAVGLAVVPSPPAWSLSLQATPSSGLAPLSVAFTAQITGSTGAFQYSWDLGNGVSSSAAAPTDTYAAGSYTVTLQVTDGSNGQSVKATTQVVARPSSGYWLVGSDGGVFSFGNASFDGSMGGKTLNAPVIGMAPTPDGGGYWLVASDGGVFTFGNAGFFGSLGSTTLNAPIVGFAPAPDGQGYWMVGADGGVFAFGDAGFYGSLPGLGISVQDIRGIAPTSDGKGYWLVGADGGIFSFGDATFYGSLPGSHISVSNIVSMSATSDGKGYWLVGADGSIYTFGDAVNYGSLAGKTLNGPIVAMVADVHGQGYLLFGSDGGVFTFGSAVFYGSEAGRTLNAPIVGGCIVP